MEHIHPLYCTGVTSVAKGTKDIQLVIKFLIKINSELTHHDQYLRWW